MKLLGLIAAVTLVPVLFAGDVPTVSWPDAYTTTGRIILPYADVLEPFNVSVNMKNKQAVYSFYNGKVEIKSTVVLYFFFFFAIKKCCMII